MYVVVSSTGFNTPQIVEAVIYYNNQWFYDVIHPTISMEPGATKFNGITDQHLLDAKSFEESNLFRILKETDTIIVQNSYTLNIISSELERFDCKPIFVLNNKTLEFKLNYKIINIETLGMHFLYKYIDSFSFNKIYNCMSRHIEHYNLNPFNLDTYKLPDFDKLMDNMIKLIDITQTFYKKIDNITEFENKPLNIFPFRGLGKQYIDDLENVSIEHLTSIMKNMNSIPVILTCREVIKKHYDDFSQFIYDIKDCRYINADEVSVYSENFIKFLKENRNFK